MRGLCVNLLLCAAALFAVAAGSGKNSTAVGRDSTRLVLSVNCGSEFDHLSNRTLTGARLLGRTRVGTWQKPKNGSNSSNKTLTGDFRTSRFAADNETIWGYDVFVNPGNFKIVLRYAETGSSAAVAKRRFDVKIQGVLRERAFDIFREGANMTHVPVSRTYGGVSVKNNVLTLRFLRRIGKPELRGFDVYRVPHESLIMPYRMNVGSSTNVNGFSAENKRFNKRAGRAIVGPDSGVISTFQSARVGELRDEFPVEDGKYDVTMHFAELDKERMRKGARLFNVHVNDRKLNGIDVYGQAGRSVMSYTFKSVDAQDGKITVLLIDDKYEPIFNAITIDREGSDTPSGTSIVVKAVNVGGEAMLGYEGDDGSLFVGSSQVNEHRTSKSISGTSSDDIYRDQRKSTNSSGILLSIPVEQVDSESYTLDLHMAETEVGMIGDRVMDISINGLRKGTFDVFEKYGSHTAASLRFNRIKPSENGTIEVAIVATAGSAMLSGFVLHKVLHDGPAPGWNTIDGTDTGDALPRHENCAVEYGGDLYMVGGRRLQNVNKYDTATRRWSQMAAPPVEVHHVQCATVGDRILVGMAFTGQYPHERTIDRLLWFHPQNDSWTWGATIPPARNRGAAATVVRGEFAYFVNGNYGGHGPHSRTLSQFDAYDIANDEWHVLPDSPVGRDHGMAALVGNKIAVIGGRNGGVSAFFDATVNTVDIWAFGDDRLSGSWTTAPDIVPNPSGGALVGALDDRRVIMAGGEGFEHMWKRTVIFDVEEMRFLDLGQGGMKRVRHGTQMVRCKNGLYAPQGAGWQGGEPELTSIEVFTMDGKMPEECKSETVH